MERSPLFAVLLFGLGAWYLARYFSTAKGSALGALDLNTINLILILLALILHWRPAGLARAVREGAPATSGVLLQFPLYGGIFGMIAYTGLSKTIAHWLVSASSKFFFPHWSRPTAACSESSCLVLFPAVLVLVTLFARTLAFP